MEKEKNNKEMGDTVTVYEVSYLLLPSLAPEQVPAHVASVKEVIEKAGGAVISSEDPVLIDLAYPMSKVIQTTRHKATTGYFGWMKFEIEKDGLAGIQKSLDAIPEILRYLIVKTVRENTLLNGRMILRKEEKESEINAEVSDEGMPVDDSAPAEDIDKSIDGLVIA